MARPGRWPSWSSRSPPPGFADAGARARRAWLPWLLDQLRRRAAGGLGAQPRHLADPGGRQGRPLRVRPAAAHPAAQRHPPALGRASTPTAWPPSSSRPCTRRPRGQLQRRLREHEGLRSWCRSATAASAPSRSSCPTTPWSNSAGRRWSRSRASSRPANREARHRTRRYPCGCRIPDDRRRRLVLAVARPDPGDGVRPHAARSTAHSLRLDTALVFDEIRTMATADERQRLAREIHDGIAQEVASLGYVVDHMASTDAGPRRSRKASASCAASCRWVVADLRLSIFDLRSDVSATQRPRLSALRLRATGRREVRPDRAPDP